MPNPFVSDYVEIRNLGKGHFVAVAKKDIPENTIVEICATTTLTKREAIILGKGIPELRDKIMVDEEVMSKEYALFTQLGELELGKRLDAGDISPDEFLGILRSKVNMNSLLDSKSHILILGNGLTYKVSENPNMVCEYYSGDKTCVFRTARFVLRGNELTYFKQ